MEKAKGGDMALRLSTEVLERKITFDEGLIRAKSLNVVEPFVEGLNILAGRDAFSIDDARRRLRSGEAERAANGKSPPFVIPSDLEGWTLGGDNRPPLDPDVFVTLEIRLQQMLSERQEAVSHLGLVEAAMRQEEKIPSPWPGPAVVLLVTLTFALVAHFQFGSMLGAALSLGIGSVVCLALFKTAMTRYEAENRRVRIAMRKRVERKGELTAEIAEHDHHVESLRSKATALLERCAPPSDEEWASLVERFPGLFAGINRPRPF